MTDPYEHEVVIVGGGAAGLTAAYELREFDPLVIEAGSAIGGRISTVDVAGTPMNLGAEYWIASPTDSYCRPLLDELGVEVDARDDDGAGGLVLNGRHIKAGTSDEIAAGLELNSDARRDLIATRARIAEALERLWVSPSDGLAADLMSVSADRWLGDVDPSVRALYNDLASVTPGSRLADLHALSFVVLLPAIGGTENRQWGAEVIRGGSAAIVTALAQRLDRPVMTDAHVLEVRQERDHVDVDMIHEQSPRTLRAHHVIVSAPAPSAAAMCRGLPSWKVDALHTVWYAPWASVDLVVEVDKPQTWSGSGSVPFLDGPVSLLLNNGEVPARDAVALRLLTGGVRLSPFLDAGTDRLETLARTQFASVFPSCGRMLASSSRMWVFGAPHFQWGSPYGTRANIESLMAPVGNVHFCGDYMGFVDADGDGGFGSGHDLDYRTTTYMSTAMRTGERAARAVRRALTRSNRRKDRP